jgi:hypothetical protein
MSIYKGATEKLLLSGGKIKSLCDTECFVKTGCARCEGICAKQKFTAVFSGTAKACFEGGGKTIACNWCAGSVRVDSVSIPSSTTLTHIAGTCTWESESFSGITVTVFATIDCTGTSYSYTQDLKDVLTREAGGWVILIKMTGQVKWGVLGACYYVNNPGCSGANTPQLIIIHGSDSSNCGVDSLSFTDNLTGILGYRLMDNAAVTLS